MLITVTDAACFEPSLRNPGATSSGDSDANKDTNSKCIKTSKLIFHVTSWFLFVCIIIFLKKNFPLKISPSNHIYLRKKKHASICFPYNIALWGSCHENIYILKFSFFHIFHCSFFFNFWLIYLGSHLGAKRIQILLGTLIGTIIDYSFQSRRCNEC